MADICKGEGTAVLRENINKDLRGILRVRTRREYCRKELTNQFFWRNTTRQQRGGGIREYVLYHLFSIKLDEKKEASNFQFEFLFSLRGRIGHKFRIDEDIESRRYLLPIYCRLMSELVCFSIRTRIFISSEISSFFTLFLHIMVSLSQTTTVWYSIEINRKTMR